MQSGGFHLMLNHLLERVQLSHILVALMQERQLSVQRYADKVQSRLRAKMSFVSNFPLF